MCIRDSLLQELRCRGYAARAMLMMMVGDDAEDEDEDDADLCGQCSSWSMCSIALAA